MISNCPANRASVITPITASLCRHMHALLTARWNIIKSFDDDQDVTEEEMFSQQMVYIVTREYANFLSQMLIKANSVARGWFSSCLSDLNLDSRRHKKATGRSFDTIGFGVIERESEQKI